MAELSDETKFILEKVADAMVGAEVAKSFASELIEVLLDKKILTPADVGKLMERMVTNGLKNRKT